MTAYLTLADYQAHPSDLVAGVVTIMREESQLMDILKFVDAGTLAVKINRGPAALPDVGWRNIGDNHGSVKGAKPDEIEEVAYSIGNEISVDKVYMKDKSKRLIDPMTYQTKLIVKSIARNFNNKFINGIPSDLKNPVGLWYRVTTDLGSEQRIQAHASGLDISADATTLGANTQAFIDLLDQLLYSLTGSIEAGGQGIYLFTNDTVILRVQSLFRQSGLVSVTQDTLGRKFMEYKGAKFIDVGRKVDDTTRIMTNAETTAGALTGGACSSIYGVKMGPEYFTAWQMYGMEVSAPELDPVHKVTYTSVIDWMVGVALSHPRSAARLYSIIAG